MPVTEHSQEHWKTNLTPECTSLREILENRKLAALGDAYTNFIFSLALTKKSGEPTGSRVDSRILATALRKAGLRGSLPSRTSRHTQADAAEALIVYAWIKNLTSLEEVVSILAKRSDDPTEAFRSLIVTVKERLQLGDVQTP